MLDFLDLSNVPIGLRRLFPSMGTFVPECCIFKSGSIDLQLAVSTYGYLCHLCERTRYIFHFIRAMQGNPCSLRPQNSFIRQYTLYYTLRGFIYFYWQGPSVKKS